MTDTTDPLQFTRGRIAAYKVIMAQCENEIRQLESVVKKHDIDMQCRPPIIKDKSLSFREYFEKRNGRKYKPMDYEMMDIYIPLLMDTIADYIDEVVK